VDDAGRDARSIRRGDADILNVSARTVAFHKYTIMEHLGLKTSAELVQYALEHGMLKKRS
jgi:FixJ family two-component response regulator